MFFRLNDIHMDYVESLIPLYVRELSSERAFIATELGKERSRFQNRFLNDMGTICKRLSEGDDSSGCSTWTSSQNGALSGPKFVLVAYLLLLLLLIGLQHSNRKNILDGFKYAASAVDLIRILNRGNDIEVELRALVKDVFVYTMELLGFYRHIKESAKLPRARYDMNTKKLAQHFRNMVKKDEIKSKPGYRGVLVTLIFPRARTEDYAVFKGIVDDTLATAPKEVSNSNFHNQKKPRCRMIPEIQHHPVDIRRTSSNQQRWSLVHLKQWSTLRKIRLTLRLRPARHKSPVPASTA